MKTFLTRTGFQAIVPGLMLLLLTSLSQSNIYGQASGSFWTKASENAIAQKGPRHTIPQKYQALSLNFNSMRGLLAQAPHEKNVSLRASGAIVALPMSDGKIARFRFVETATMAPELAARFPQIRTFLGIGVDDRSLSVAFDLTPAGFHGMIHSKDGLDFIDPYSQGDVLNYIAYAKKDYIAGPNKKFIENDVLGTETENAKKIAELVEQRRAQRMQAQASGAVERPSGDQLRTYRVAIAATGEYTAFHGGTVGAALAAINTTLNRVNFVYIREVDVRMTLVGNETNVIYTNSSTDPYSNGNPGAMIGQAQADIDARIGTANYDIGHVFGTNSGGLASLGVVCQAGVKARGVTGSGAPVGDAFDIDYVAHEMGHQFGANHTFNGNSGACSGNANTNTAFEPGSGSTIMAYAGICGAQDLQPNSDAYFHTASYDEIFAYTELGAGNGCAVITNPVNTAPVPTIVTTSNLTIPRQTPFTITGSATDAHNDPITYCWEEYDLGPAGHPDFPSGNAPIFRSFTGTSSGSRTFPKQSDLLNNVHTIGELLPSYARTLKFNLTVRDNYAFGGGVDWAYPLYVNVSGTAGPFVVTFPNSAMTLPGGSAQTVTWNVAGTNLSPISTANVRILLSTNGGVSFPTVLLSSTPNDGSQSVTLPNNINTTTARIKVEAIGNIYFDISNANFTIIPTPVISSFAPTSGPAGVGVMIKGINFNNVSAIKFNGVTATVTYIPSTSLLYAAVPAGATTGKIQVVAQGGTATSAANFTVAPISSVWLNKKALTTERSQHGAIGTNGRIYAFGGWNSGGLLNSLEIYNPVTNAWTAGAPIPTASRGMSFALGSNGLIYVISGFTGTAITNAYSYNPVSNTWAVLASIPGAVWEGAAASSAGGKVYVFGGEPAGGGITNATRIYDIASNTWGTGAAMPVGVMQHTAVTGADGRIYVFGGRPSSSSGPVDYLQIYNPATNTWVFGPSMPIPKVQFGAVKANNGKIYVVGGKAAYINSAGPFFHSVEIYDPSTNSWSTGPVIRAQAGELEATNLNGNLYAIGGTDGTYRNYNFQLQLAPTVTSFYPTSGAVGVGVAVRGTNFVNVTAVRFNGVTATEFYVASPTLLYATVPAGASTGKIEVVADGASGLSAANFTVTPSIASIWVAKTGMATPRSQHGAIATNNRIYAFGGFNSGGLLNSLEIYNPATNAWAAGAPMPSASRGMSFALGNNGKIYVISGYDGTYVTSAYSYTPTTNTWAVLAGIPNAVWEGAAATAASGKIYVFGGEPSGGGSTNATRIYDVASNTWGVGANMPIGVQQHTAVTGADGKIYIFGGRTSAFAPPIANVQVYNPATNTWANGAPMIIPKTQFGAVRAGDGRIYIVGGKVNYINNAGPFFHTVEIYNPATNAWVAGPVIRAQDGELEAVNLNDNLYAIGGTDGTYRNYNFQLTLPPVAPTTLTATAVSNSQINLKWKDNAKNETNYVVERALAAAGPYAAIAPPLPANAIAYNNTGLASGTIYYYRVKATNSAGSSAYSNIAFDTTFSPRPATSAPAPVTSVDERPGKANSLSVQPNPVRVNAKITFSVVEDQPVELSIYDMQGNLVEKLFQGKAEAGKMYQFDWNTGNRASGMYINRLVTPGGVVSQKIVVLSGGNK